MTGLHIEKLAAKHVVEGFDCGRAALNNYLIRFALPNQRASTAQTYIGLDNENVIGYYTLVVGEVAYDDAPNRLAFMLLARLAIRQGWQGKGLGAGLLKDAMRRTVQAAGIAGIRAFAVHAKGDAAVAFYRHFDFLPSPTDPFHLFLLLKDLKATLSKT